MKTTIIEDMTYWEWSDDCGVTYQACHLEGTDTVRLYSQRSYGFTFVHQTVIEPSETALDVLQDLYEETGGVGFVRA